ncbi:glycoside hydrolase family 5 protein [Methylocystis iwaonis]|uniref:glycoside hydrolase family 5 protein n=1 Tax=Methylocystis iwaonis TaxID=2885079 RepID=UPI002E7BA601|nr:glycoside hydrolase family 5 protein [Methylocystis iwaonis]
MALFSRLSAIALAASLVFAPNVALCSDAWKTGVNLSGAELNPGRNRPNIDYVLPTTQQIDYFAARGLLTFRIPVLSSRLFVSDKSIVTEDWRALVSLIDYAARKGADVIVDLHQYGAIDSRLIGRDASATQEFAAVWGEIAARLRGRTNVVFGLMNEPHEQSAAEWLTGGNAAIAAIRKSGARQLILVPGSYWSGAHSWTNTDNGAVMTGVVDPGDNFAYELHQYLDADSSGTSPQASLGAGKARLKEFTEWARARHAKAFLGEFGFAATPEALAEGRAMLDFMAQNRDVWIGWAYWAAGAWWGDYMFSVEPKDGHDRPQMSILSAYGRARRR